MIMVEACLFMVSFTMVMEIMFAIRFSLLISPDQDDGVYKRQEQRDALGSVAGWIYLTVLEM